MHAARMYLDLLKQSLTDTLYGREPDVDAGLWKFAVDFRRHYILNERAATMLPRSRLDHLQECIEDVVRDRVAGDLLEAGVWRGGATIFMRGVLGAYGIADRRVWVADSFEGLPEPDAVRFPKEAAVRQGPVMRESFGLMAASLEQVKANFARYGLLDEQVRFLPGWFRDTLPAAPVERIAVLRIDGDFHDSTREALEGLYDRVSPGGYVIVDDYGEDDWTYCRAAVDGFRRERSITAELRSVDSRCVFWRRPA